MRIRATIKNLEAFLREQKLRDAGTRKNVTVAIKRGTDAVRGGAERRAPERTGELRSSIRAEFSKDGLTGFVKAGYGKLQRRSRAVTAGGKARAKSQRKQAKSSRDAQRQLTLGVYAPVVERGDPKRNKPARPFMNPSLRAERPKIQSDIAKAMESGLRTGGTP